MIVSKSEIFKDKSEKRFVRTVYSKFKTYC